MAPDPSLGHLGLGGFRLGAAPLLLLFCTCRFRNFGEPLCGLGTLSRGGSAALTGLRLRNLGIVKMTASRSHKPPPACSIRCPQPPPGSLFAYSALPPPQPRAM